MPTCRTNGPLGQRIDAEQVKLECYQLPGEHIGSEGECVHAGNLQQAFQDIDAEGQRVLGLVKQYKKFRVVRKGTVPGGKVGEPYLADDNVWEIPVWFNEIDCDDFTSFSGGQTYLPIGSVVAWPVSNKVPLGWMIADGRLLKRADYLSLFKVLAFHYGRNAQTGASMFRIPDLRGKMLMGLPARAQYRNIVFGRYDSAPNPHTQDVPTQAFVNSQWPTLPAKTGYPHIDTTNERDNLIVGSWHRPVPFEPVIVETEPEVADETITVPSTMFTNWIIKVQNDDELYIREAEFVAGTEQEWKAEIVNGKLTLTHPPAISCAGVSDGVWTLRSGSSSGLALNQWKQEKTAAGILCNSSIHIVSSGDTNQANIRAYIADNASGSNARSIGWQNSVNSHASLKFDVPKGWWWKVDNFPGTPNTVVILMT